MVDPKVSVKLPETPAASSMFQVNWGLYRKMIENNYLFHSDVYGRLHEILRDEIGRRYSFLDIACGDGTASIKALRGTLITRYFGIDQSRPALDTAKVFLAELPCPVSCFEGDFQSLIQSWQEPVDVAWIELSLHHLLWPEKMRLMSAIRRLLASDGRLLIYENTSPDGEDREGWMKRWLLQKEAWTAYDEDEWNSVWVHVSNCDFPETDEAWRQLGAASGFSSVRELFRAPTDLFRMYEFLDAHV